MEINKQDKNSREKRPTSANDAAGASGTETKKRFVKNRTGMRSAGSGTGTSMQATALPERREKQQTPAKRRETQNFAEYRPNAERKSETPSRRPMRRVQPRATEAGAVAAEEKYVRNAKKKRPVKIFFLGGVGEIGKNMTAIEYGGDIIIIDAGITFPNNEDMPGIDLVVPDITYLVKNKDKVKGILLTHGHEDHIGGIPYLLKELNPGTPVYGTKLTLMLADNKIQEHRIQNVTERVVSREIK